MTVESLPASSTLPVDPQLVGRKVALRIVPLFFLLYVVSYLDRANAGFAKLKMESALNFPEEVFGWAFGVFFLGYLLLEIPGALIVEHWSARKWFARILITWGFCSMGIALVRTPAQFYLARFLLGVAEAGFFPGIIVYFSHWFPKAARGRALGGMLLAVPVSLALGVRVSAWLLEANWLGVAGWQWVFIVEGLPAVLLGIAVPFLMTDRPAQALWLTPDERVWLESSLAEERKLAAAAGVTTLGQALCQPTVLFLAMGILATNIGGYALVFWMPTAVKSLLLETQGAAADGDVLNWTGLVYGCGLGGVWLSAWSSDRTGDRKWHCVTGQVLTGVFLAASVIPGQSWTMVFLWLCLVGFFSYFWISPFWVLPTLTLSASAAAVSIGLINMSANVAGLIGPSIVGQMKKYEWDDHACLLFLASCFGIGAIIIASLPIPRLSKESPRPSFQEETRIQPHRKV